MGLIRHIPSKRAQKSPTENPCVLPEKLRRFYPVYPTASSFENNNVSLSGRGKGHRLWKKAGIRSTGKNERQGSGLPSVPLSSVPPSNSTETVSHISTAAVRSLTDDQDCIGVFEVCLGTSNHSGRLIYARTVMIPQPIVTAAVHMLKRDERGKLRKPTLPTQGKKKKVPR